MSNVPSLFEEYFNNKIADLCDNIKNEADKIVQIIPTLQNQDNIQVHTNKLYEILDSAKKDFDFNFELLFNMTHLHKEDNEFKVVTYRKNRKNKKH